MPWLSALVLDLVADEEKLPLEFVIAHLGRIGRPTSTLFDIGAGLQRLLAQHRAVHRHGAPAEDENLVLIQHRLSDVAANGPCV